MNDTNFSDAYQDALALVKHLSDEEKCALADEINVCPHDCDRCHDEDCICERLGCANSEAPGAR